MTIVSMTTYLLTHLSGKRQKLFGVMELLTIFALRLLSVLLPRDTTHFCLINTRLKRLLQELGLLNSTM